MQAEYVLRRTDAEGEWFSLMDHEAFCAALTPATRQVTILEGPGKFCFEIATTTFSFVWEDPGISVVCVGDMHIEEQLAILTELLEQIRTATGETGRIMEL